MPKMIKEDVTAKYASSASEKGCDQVVNLCCCDGAKPEYHYIEPKQEYCCYEISMKRMRVLENKGGDGKAELMIAGYANEHSAVFPGLGCWFVAHEKWGWVNINKPVGGFKIKKGSSLTVQLNADIIEAGAALEGNFEIGSDQEATHYMTIGCETGISTEVIKVALWPVRQYDLLREPFQRLGCVTNHLCR